MPVATASLELLLGADRIRSDAVSCERFQVDGVTPGAVVEPASTEELVEIVAWARANKTALLPVTSGLYLPLGNPPSFAPRASEGEPARVRVAVSLARLNRVLHYDPGDLTLGVEAGLPLGELQKLLAEKNQFLPADPPYGEKAALGGLLATNASGPLRYAFGTWRDFTLGLTAVTGYAKRVKTGGRVVKNVAGYDLAKLLIGSLGTLGIITEINFKVFPRPPASATFVAGFAEMSTALEMAARIVQSVWQPWTLELLSPTMGALLSTQPLSPLHWSLVVSTGGVEPVLRRYQSDFSALARELRAAQFDVLRGHDEAFVLAAVRERIPRARAAHPAATIVKAALPLTQLGPFLSKARQVAERYELPHAAAAHAGSGIAYIYLLPAAEADAPKAMAQAATEMIHAGTNFGGRVTIPWCPPEVKRDVNPWGPLRDDFPLMQKLKAAFDPDRVLNPGRFLGGL